MQHESGSNTGRAKGLGAVAGLGAAALLALAACGGADDSSDGSGGGGDDADTAEELTAGTTPEDPLAIGDTVESLDWDITVTEVQLDATEEIVSSSALGSGADEGNQLALVTYEGTYKGDDPENSFYSELIVSFEIGGTAYEDCGSGHFPPGMYTEGPVENGDTVSSAFCAEIPADQAGDALVLISEWTPVTERTAFYFQTS